MLADYFSNVELITLLISLVDILLVWVLVYFALVLLKGTRGIQLLKGILIIVILKVTFNIIGFKTMSYIIDQLVTWGVLAIIIIFQPEIRRTLEHIGRIDLFNLIFKRQNTDTDREKSKVISMVSASARHMARRRIGALIVLENNTGLDEYTDSGVKINSEISTELIINLFIPNTPLHDGALILNKEKLRAASCVLPLSDNRDIDSKYGTRHRAALGLSEHTDAITIVISEETGVISVARNGKLITDFTEETLAEYLEKHWLVVNKDLGGAIIVQR